MQGNTKLKVRLPFALTSKLQPLTPYLPLLLSHLTRTLTPASSPAPLTPTSPHTHLPSPPNPSAVYDPATNAWSTNEPNINTSPEFGKAVSVGDYIYFVGKKGTSRYNPAVDSAWTALGTENPTDTRDKRQSSGVVVRGTLIYAVGGWSWGKYSTGVYDTVAGTWAEGAGHISLDYSTLVPSTADHPIPDKSLHTKDSAALIGNKIYTFHQGGCEAYDFDTGAWSGCTSAGENDIHSVASSDACAAAYDGKVYISGGGRSENAAIYDAATDSWSLFATQLSSLDAGSTSDDPHLGRTTGPGCAIL